MIKLTVCYPLVRADHISCFSLPMKYDLKSQTVTFVHFFIYQNKHFIFFLHIFPKHSYGIPAASWQQKKWQTPKCDPVLSFIHRVLWRLHQVCDTDTDLFFRQWQADFQQYLKTGTFLSGHECVLQFHPVFLHLKSVSKGHVRLQWHEIAWIVKSLFKAHHKSGTYRWSHSQFFLCTEGL